MLASFKSRLALTNLAIMLIALFVLTFVFAQLLLQHGTDVGKKSIAAQAKLVQRDIDNDTVLALQKRISIGTFYSYFKHDAQLLHMRIIYLTGFGECGFDSDYNGPPQLTPCLPVDYGRWLLAPLAAKESVTKVVKLGGNSDYVTQLPTSRGAVVIITRASTVIPPVATVAPVFLVAGLAAFGVFVLMALYFTYAISRPLAKITAAARGMAGGDYSQRVNVRAGDEIGELARGFNHMATQVGASHQLLRDFVANVSHDLRTPLTLISGYAGTLLDGTAETVEEKTAAAAVISDEAGRMERLVDNLLQLTKLESGTRKFDQAPVSVHDVIEITIRRTSAARNGRTILNAVSTHLPLAMADEELMERALMNLLNNAVEYTPPDGKIEVSASVNSGWIEIAVSDTGPGIAREDQAHVFDRFYRVDRSRNREAGHSGLGLPIVKEIVEAHGGTLNLESEPGHGSIFKFTIPRFTPQA